MDSSVKTRFPESRWGSKTSKKSSRLKEFVARLSTEAYTKWLCNSLQSLCIGLPVKRHSVKRRLNDILTEELSSDEDVEDAPVKRRISWNSGSEDDTLPVSASIVEKSSSSKKNCKKQKKAKKNSFKCSSFCFLAFFYIFCVNFYLDLSNLNEDKFQFLISKLKS